MIDPKFYPKHYQQCTATVMDNIADPAISFDENGLSNYFHEFKAFASQDCLTPEYKTKIYHQTIQQIKVDGKGKKYDCLIGLSGGADSTYLAYLAKQENLRPLVVHIDYGWNTDASISNIENTVKALGYELYTYVIDWEIVKDLQRSYYKASVVDLDVPADHIIFGAIFKIAKKMGIKTILSGTNYQTEYILPKAWHYLKTDLANIKGIHNQFGSCPFKGVPTNGVLDQIRYWLGGHKMVPLLHYIHFNQAEVTSQLERELNWRSYESKHFENVFTRFHHGYVLPAKFGIDMRKAYFSNLICSGQMERASALTALEIPYYAHTLQMEDKMYVAKKLMFSTEEFEGLLTKENVPHEVFGTDAKLRRMIYNTAAPFLSKTFKKMAKEKILRKG